MEVCHARAFLASFPTPTSLKMSLTSGRLQKLSQHHHLTLAQCWVGRLLAFPLGILANYSNLNWSNLSRRTRSKLASQSLRPSSYISDKSGLLPPPYPEVIPQVDESETFLGGLPRYSSRYLQPGKTPLNKVRLKPSSIPARRSSY